MSSKIGVALIFRIGYTETKIIEGCYSWAEKDLVVLAVVAEREKHQVGVRK